MRRGRVTATAALVIALAALALFIRPAPEEEQPGAARASSAAPAARDGVRVARPLTYAEGQTIHLGERSIDTGLDVLSLDVTDDGAAFTTFDGLLWFTDGSVLHQIGLTSRATTTRTSVLWGPAGGPDGRIVSATYGSLLAWLEYPQPSGQLPRPEIVVYDSHRQRRVARVPVVASPQCAVCVRIVGIHDGAVYWTDGPQSTLLRDEQIDSSARLMRLDVSTRRQTQVPVRSYLASLRSSRRVLVVGDSPGSGTVGDGVGEDFGIIDGRLVVHALGRRVDAFDPTSGRRLLLRTPPRFGYGLGPAQWLYLVEWLDDDRFALLDATGWDHGTYRGEDLLVCSIADERCSVAVSRPDSAGSPIVPGLYTPGSELAVAHAAQDSEGAQESEGGRDQR